MRGCITSVNKEQSNLVTLPKCLKPEIKAQGRTQERNNMKARDALLKLTQFIYLFIRLSTLYPFQRERFVRNILRELMKLMCIYRLL